MAHSVHDQKSVEYVGPILSSLSRLHGGFMQRTGHREVGAEQAQSWGRMWPMGGKKPVGKLKHTWVVVCPTATGSRLMTPAAYSSETNDDSVRCLVRGAVVHEGNISCRERKCRKDVGERKSYLRSRKISVL